MFLQDCPPPDRQRRKWSLKTTVASLGAMMLTTAGLALLPTTAAAADVTDDAVDTVDTLVVDPLSPDGNLDGDEFLNKDDDDADGDSVLKTDDLNDLDAAILGAPVVEEAPVVTTPVPPAAAPEPPVTAPEPPALTPDPPVTAPDPPVTGKGVAPVDEGEATDELKRPDCGADTIPFSKGGNGPWECMPPCDIRSLDSNFVFPGGEPNCEPPDPCQVGARNIDLPDNCCVTAAEGSADSRYEGGNDNCCFPQNGTADRKGQRDECDNGYPGHDDECDNEPVRDLSASSDERRGGKDEGCDNEGPDGGWNNDCERPDWPGKDNLSATESERMGGDWEKNCYTKPRIDIDVENWCPTEIEVEISNLKKWLDYDVKINGDWVDIDVHHGKATISVDDFDHGKFTVLVKYEKKWGDDDKKWDSEKKWGHGGKVFEKEWIKEYDCPVISAEEEQECNKVDGKAEWEIKVKNLDSDRKYLVTVAGDDYKKHFWVEDKHWFAKDLKLEEGDYTVTVESWAHKGGDDWGGDMRVQGGGGHYDHADVGPIEYDFTVDGCPVDVAVEPSENCKSIKAVLDTLVEGREYIVKVKDSEGDVVFEKTVWGPTTLDEKFQQDTYTVIVIDVKARDHGDHSGGWGGWDGHDNGSWDPWKGHDEEETLVAVVGDEFSYDKDWSNHDGDNEGDDEWNDNEGDNEWEGDNEGDNEHHGDNADHGKKGKGLKWTATITLSDCPTPPVVEPAGNETDNNGGGSPSPSVEGTGGGVLATTGADPAGMALAALILLPVGGAVLATRSVIARRKNAA